MLAALPLVLQNRVEPLCNQWVTALAHSLWEGSALVIMAMAVTWRMKSPRGRYFSHAAAAVILALMPVLTFVWVHERDARSERAVPHVASPAVVEQVGSSTHAVSRGRQAMPEMGFGKGFPSSDVGFGERERMPGRATTETSPRGLATVPIGFAKPVTALYLAGVGLMFLRVAGLTATARRLRREAEGVAEEGVLRSLERTAARLGLRSLPRLLQATGREIPSVIGVLRPAILLPAALLTGMTPGQLEIILAHELAHIRRCDPLINFLQRVLEAFLFYHPATWYLSRRLRIERELCCDDLVLGLGYEPDAYAAALTRAAEMCVALPSGSHALAAAGKPSELRVRILRVLGFSAVDELRPRRSALAVAVGVGLMFTPLLVQQRPAVAQAEPATRPTAQPTSQPTSQPAGTVVTTIIARAAETGEPLAGARVGVRTKTSRTFVVMTDDGGRAPIALQANEDNTFSVTVSAPAREARHVIWGNRGEGRKAAVPAAETVILLPRGIQISGVVKDPEGKPVEGAQVSVSLMIEPPGRVPELPADGVPRYTNRDVPAITDKDGRWSMDSAPAAFQQASVSIEHPDYVRYRSSFVPGPDLRGGKAQFSLSRGETVMGTVVDEGGKPIAGATVRALEYRPSDEGKPVTTKADGGFSFSHLSMENLQLFATAPGKGPVLQEVTVVKDNVVKLEPAVNLKVRVLTRDDKPVSDAGVSIDEYAGQRRFGLFKPFKSDANGQVTIPLAHEPVVLDAFKGGYAPARQVRLAAGATEVVIRLSPPRKISGTAVDAETGKPLENFRVVVGDEESDGRTLWQSFQSKRFSDGSFEMTASDHRTGQIRVKVEAPGYEPAVSDVFTSEAVFHASLKKAAVFTGHVVDAAGQPVIGATVVEVTAGGHLNLNEGHLIVPTDLEQTKSGDGGTFTFSMPGGPVTFVAFDDAHGIACVDDATAGTAPIALLPWATLEGTVRVNDVPTPGIRLMGDAGHDLGANSRQNETPIPLVSILYDVVSDAQGHYRMERVVPGKGTVGREERIAGTEMSRSASTVRFNAKPGETLTIDIGGTGRPVVGKVIPPQGSTVKWRYSMMSTLQTKDTFKPTVPNYPEGFKDWPLEQRRAWTEKYNNTPEAKARHAARMAEVEKFKYYSMNIQPNGSFRVEDVDPGTYVVRIDAFDAAAGEPMRMNSPDARGTAEVTVPPLAPGITTRPLMMDDVVMVATSNLKYGQAAPEFELTTLEGKAMKLSDYRGKWVVLDFWAAWCGPCVEHISQVKAAWKAMADMPNAAMLGISLDRKPEDTQGVVTKNGISWPQALIGGFDSPVAKAYGVHGIPAFFLIAPDGTFAGEFGTADQARMAMLDRIERQPPQGK